MDSVITPTKIGIVVYDSEILKITCRDHLGNKVIQALQSVLEHVLITVAGL